MANAARIALAAASASSDARSSEARDDASASASDEDGATTLRPTRSRVQVVRALRLASASASAISRAWRLSSSRSDSSSQALPSISNHSDWSSMTVVRLALVLSKCTRRSLAATAAASSSSGASAVPRLILPRRSKTSPPEDADVDAGATSLPPPPRKRVTPSASVTSTYAPQCVHRALCSKNSKATCESTPSLALKSKIFPHSRQFTYDLAKSPGASSSPGRISRASLTALDFALAFFSTNRTARVSLAGAP